MKQNPDGKNSSGSMSSDGAGALSILGQAIKAVPALRFALAAAGLSAAGSLIIAMLGSGRAAVFIMIGTFVATILMYLFSNLVENKNKHIDVAGIFMLYCVILLFVVFIFISIFAIITGKPERFACTIGIGPCNIPPESDIAVVTDCDSLAQPPREVFGSMPSLVKGIYQDKIDSKAAISACLDATKKFPNEPRFDAYLGRAYVNSEGWNVAIPYYIKASEKDNAVAQLGLANAYEYLDQSGNDSNIRRLLRLSSSKGFLAATASLGNYLWYNGAPHEKSEAFSLIQSAANKGHRVAQYQMGLFYSGGLYEPYLKQDIEVAIKWYRLASTQGDVMAMSGLATILSSGQPDISRDSEAVELYRAVADSGSGSSYSAVGPLARLLLAGRGIPAGQQLNADKEAAMRVQENIKGNYWKASDEYIMGFMLETGRGVPANRDKALEHYKLSSQKGHKPAQDALARLLNK